MTSSTPYFHPESANRVMTRLTLCIAILATFASSAGIFITTGPGPESVETIRGVTVTTYGYGLYYQMSQDVAPQGIAQDVVTLFLGVPLLLWSLIRHRKGSIVGTYLLTGTTSYLLVTYLFYLTMAMYNVLFLVYAALLGCTFFSLFLCLQTLYHTPLKGRMAEPLPWKASGWFLILNGAIIAQLWLSLVIPPLMDGSIYPDALAYYTTMIVQGLDLGLLLPLSFLAGWLSLRKRPMAQILTPVYLIFLSLIMLALLAKLIAMGWLGSPIFPAVVVIPVLGAFAVWLSYRWLRQMTTNPS